VGLVGRGCRVVPAGRWTFWRRRWGTSSSKEPTLTIIDEKKEIVMDRNKMENGNK
jgi:hypothetical protein